MPRGQPGSFLLRGGTSLGRGRCGGEQSFSIPGNNPWGTGRVPRGRIPHQGQQLGLEGPQGVPGPPGPGDPIQTQRSPPPPSASVLLSRSRHNLGCVSLARGAREGADCSTPPSPSRASQSGQYRGTLPGPGKHGQDAESCGPLTRGPRAQPAEPTGQVGVCHSGAVSGCGRQALPGPRPAPKA